jgi:hypothetical protein
MITTACQQIGACCSVVNFFSVYGGRDPLISLPNQTQHEYKIFPELRDVKIDYAWVNFALSFTRTADALAMIACISPVSL